MNYKWAVFQTILSRLFSALHFLQFWKLAFSSPDKSSSITPVLTSMPHTRYGSMFEAGLRSSMYPFPFALAVDVGMRNEAARLPTPYEKSLIELVSWMPVSRF